MKDPETTSIAAILKDTLSEIRHNMSHAAKEAKKEWQQQLEDKDSPLSRARKRIKDPSSFPEPLKEQILQTVNNLKSITDGGLDTIKSFLKRLH